LECYSKSKQIVVNEHEANPLRNAYKILTLSEFLEFIARVAEKRFKDQDMALQSKVYYVIRDIVGPEFVINPSKEISQRHQK
jgi:hypothetical protein